MKEVMVESRRLKAPFPYFGGKGRVADRIWSALGDVDIYVEPFAGSLAALLGRPEWHARKIEIVNDAERYLANFWRALQAAPDEVAEWADWPVNECDLFARHLWLVNEGRERIAKLESDPDLYDAKVAGWWVWGLCSWIGGGWCSGSGPWRLIDGEAVDARKLPHLEGVKGVQRQRPHLGPGNGVHRKLPHLGPGKGVNRKNELIEYMRRLADRLRYVRVCCGDWSRVVTRGALANGRTVGIFLDPPYLGELRDKDIYVVDGHEISIAVRDWAIARGGDPRYRIVMAGYVQEHFDAMPADWSIYRYSAKNSYCTAKSARSKKGNSINRHNEALWFSPHCLKQERLF